MRLALIGPVFPYRGGIAHYTTMLCRTLRAEGHEVLMVSLKRQYPQWLFPGGSDKDPSKERIEIEDAQYWIDSLNPITWVKAFWRIRSYCPDAIILQWWTTFWAPAWLVLGLLNRLFLRKPLIYISHNVLPHETYWWDPYLTRMTLHWGTHFIVQSAEEKERLLSLLPGAQAVIAPLPALDLFAPQQISKEMARKQLGLPLEVPTLLFFGIVREYKGLKDLLAAMPEVRARLGEVMLVIAGEFWEDERPYLKMIEQLGVSDSVIIEDRYIPNEEVALYFSATDVLVAPYQRVTGSAVVKMALGNNRPVITTRVGSLPDAVEHGVTGLLTQAENSQALAEAVVRFFHEGLEGNRKRKGADVGTPLEWDHIVRLIQVMGRKCE